MRTSPLNLKVLQDWGQFGVTPCHPSLLLRETGVVPSKERMATAGLGGIDGEKASLQGSSTLGKDTRHLGCDR